VRLLPILAACSAALVAGAALFAACSLPEGSGSVTGTIEAPDCWSGKFDLNPDFFAGVPYRNSLQLRIQRGGDYETFSDGISILIDDLTQIRPADDGSKPGLYGVPIAVSLPAGVAPPGVPITPNASPAQVHFALYLQHSCRTQNVALYALDQVQLGADGTCNPSDAGTAALPCAQLGPAQGVGLDGGATDGSAPDAAASTDAGLPTPAGPIGRSTITFQSLFDGNPDEEHADKRLNQGSFHVYLADPRDICPGGLGPPPRCRGELTGDFDFYFQRGRPAQPFP
jgi:hypothetical protein